MVFRPAGADRNIRPEPAKAALGVECVHALGITPQIGPVRFGRVDQECATPSQRLAPIAEASGRRVIEGKQTVELVPEGVPLKGGVVRRLLSEHPLRAALYAGDDAADLEAFTELGRARDDGVVVLRVAVRAAETPSDLLNAADLIVDGPDGLVELLRELIPAG